MLTMLLLSACLVNHELYEERAEALADDITVEEGDCDDSDPGVGPGIAEVCDGKDQDCDGEVDEDAVDAGVWYLDGDGDQVGAGDPVEACEPDDGWVASGDDCDDGEASIHPGAAEEPYDGVDQDCDQADLTDVDDDGWDAVEAGGEDCDDQDPDTWPGAPDDWYDGVDSDCGGEDDYDQDGDGVSSAIDCDDTDAAVHPGASETWANGATDNDCDGDYGAATLEYGAEAWTGEGAGDNAGRRIAALGDVTGDGLAEFAVAATYEAGTYSYGGSVYVVAGGGEPGPLVNEGVLRSGGEGWLLGSELDAGDVDGDGLPDLLASGAGFADGRGATWLVSSTDLPGAGEELALEAAASWRMTGDQPSDYAGSAAAVVGDLDGDGLEDVAVGAPFVDHGGYADSGQVGVFLDCDGAPDLEDADLLVGGDYEEAKLGTRLQAAGDQDGDGYEDFMVGYADGRMAQIFQGNSEELDVDAPLSEIVEDGEIEDFAPWMVGDVDSDGRRDLALIVDSDRVLLFTLLVSNPSRSTASPNATLHIEGDSYMFTALNAGDLDGDGTDETVITANWYEPSRTAAGVLVFGTDMATATDLWFGDVPLRFESQRVNAAFGYRAAISEDTDGDGLGEIILGGPADPHPDELVGAVATVPLPQ